MQVPAQLVSQELVPMNHVSDQQDPQGLDAVIQHVDTQLTDDAVMQHVDTELIDERVPPSPPAKRKRQSQKGPTPVVDDMVWRSIRKRKPEGFRHVHLDFVKGQRGPRETPTSPVLEDHLQSIEEAAAGDDEAMIPIEAK